MSKHTNLDIVKGKFYNYFLGEKNTVVFYNYNGKEVITKNYLIASNRGYAVRFNKNMLTSYEKEKWAFEFLAQVNHKDVIEREGSECISIKETEDKNKDIYFIAFVYGKNSVILNYYNRYMSAPLFIKSPANDIGQLTCLVMDLIELHNQALADKIKAEVFNFRKNEEQEVKNSDVQQNNT